MAAKESDDEAADAVEESIAPTIHAAGHGTDSILHKPRRHCEEIALCSENLRN